MRALDRGSRNTTSGCPVELQLPASFANLSAADSGMAIVTGPEVAERCRHRRRPSCNREASSQSLAAARPPDFCQRFARVAFRLAVRTLLTENVSRGSATLPVGPNNRTVT